MERYLKLLEVYTLEEILDNIELEPAELLVVLEVHGYLDNLDLPEPL